MAENKKNARKPRTTKPAGSTSTPKVEKTKSDVPDIWTPERSMTTVEANNVKDQLLKVQIAQENMTEMPDGKRFYLSIPSKTEDAQNVDRLDCISEDKRPYSGYITSIANLVILINPKDRKPLADLKMIGDTWGNPYFMRFQEYLKINPEVSINEIIFQIVIKLPIFNRNASAALTKFFQTIVHRDNCYTGYDPVYKDASAEAQKLRLRGEFEEARVKYLEASNALRSTPLLPQIEDESTAKLSPVCIIL